MLNDSSQPTTDDPIDIFLAEDNPGDVRLIQEALKPLNNDISLEVATNGHDAVDRLLQQHSTGSTPDIVLLDLNLPGRDGCAVLDAIRDDSDIQTLPVLILTSSTSEEDITRCYDADANAYLTKPTDPVEFSSMMESVERFWFENARLPSAPA